MAGRARASDLKGISDVLVAGLADCRNLQEPAKPGRAVDGNCETAGACEAGASAERATAREAGGKFGNRKSAVYWKIASALFSERQIAAKRCAPPPLLFPFPPPFFPLSFPSLFSICFFFPQCSIFG